MGGNHSSPGVQDSRRHVCILYNGNDSIQRNNARAFRDALRAGDGGKNFRIQFTDVNHEHFDGVQWLRQIQNVLVLCVDENSAESLQRIIDRREIRPNDGMPRVLSVSFGTTRPQTIMGEILQRPGNFDQKDFCFGFEDVRELTANDFHNSPTMRQLKTSIMSA